MSLRIARLPSQFNCTPRVFAWDSKHCFTINMVGGNQDQEADDPLPEDVGIFISQADLEEWWSAMQQRYPGIFPEEEKVMKQYPEGTKLMTYFDGDPDKPIRLTILGSKFRNEIPNRKYAFYIVQYKDSEDMCYLHVTAAHEEEWCVGWDAPPPS